MTIQAGTRLGPYEIVAPLGAGGMGEVWRARDTRLEREVAIKILPPDFAANEQFLARFEREAKTVSSLNHPHICTLHDVGHDSGTHYLVMEMIEGESLADRLTKGRLPMDQVLRAGGQIAAALDAAHRKGVVHRDLKPGNVMLTKSGAKLLDFGLAKSGVPTSGVIEGMTEMPTQARPLTKEGTILGTFQYMAPEQLEGQDADARTDIFALGALLYEMATGQRAFDGKTRTSLIASIVSGTPRPVSELVPMTPPAFEHVVRRCLEKDPDDRWQSTHDIADQLRWISEAGSQAGVPAPIARRRITRDRALAIALVFALAAAAVLGLMQYRAGSRHAQAFSLVIPAITDTYSQASAATVSPDGTTVAFTATSGGGPRRIWIRRLDSFAAAQLDGTDGASNLCWSPDSSAIAFSSGGSILRVDAAGGAVRTVASQTGVVLLEGLTWSASGVILAGAHDMGIFKVSAAGGKLEPLVKPDPSTSEFGYVCPQILADGKRFLFSARSHDPKGEDAVRSLYLGSLDGTPPRRIGPVTSRVFVDEENGYLLYVSDGTLMAVKFDPRTATMSGEPVAILDDISFFNPVGSTNISLSKTGVLTAQAAPRGSRLQWLDFSGRRLGALGDEPVSSQFRFSPDGTRVYAALFDRKIGTNDLFAFDATHGGGSRLTFGRGWEADPVPSVDGKTLFYAADKVGVPDIYAKAIDSPEEDKLLLQRPAVQFPRDVSPDGSLLLYQTSEDAAMRTDLWILPLKGDAKPYPFVRSPATETGGRFSPDGRSVAYTSNESGKRQIYVRPFPGPGPARQISRNGGNLACWSRDGRSLYFLDEGRLYRANVPFDGEPELLFENKDIDAFELAPDGKRILALMTSEFDASPPMRVITNWRSLLPKGEK